MREFASVRLIGSTPLRLADSAYYEGDIHTFREENEPVDGVC